MRGPPARMVSARLLSPDLREQKGTSERQQKRSILLQSRASPGPRVCRTVLELLAKVSPLFSICRAAVGGC
jgi:hypothetical protein